MRQIKYWALASLFSLGVFGQSSITGACRNGGTYPNCIGGEIVFTGGSYPEQAHVKVTNSAGQVIDDGDYTTKDGVLTFTENLSFADTYAIAVNDKVVLMVTTT